MKNIPRIALSQNISNYDEEEYKVKALIARIKKGDNRSFAELVKRYRNQVASLAYKIVNDYDEAADISQIVFIKTLKNIWRYDEKKKFYTWLYRITVNASIDYVRKHHRHRMEPIDNLANNLEHLKSDPEFSYRRQQINEYIHQATQTLNDKQLSAFTLRDLEGCKVDDVAVIMNMPVATVRWYLHRARTKIRKELMRNCPHLLFILGIK
ncbi:MAG: RNA polymerase sigma factor [Candidatus Zixiibacteriota bacterium]